MLKITVEIEGREPFTIESATFDEVAPTLKDHSAAVVATLQDALRDIADPAALADALAERALAGGILADWADGGTYRIPESDEAWCLAQGATPDDLPDIGDAVHQILCDAAAEARAEWAAEQAYQAALD